jgi:hypothetical protein
MKRAPTQDSAAYREIARVSDRIQRNTVERGAKYMKSPDYALDMYAIIDRLPTEEKGKILLKSAVGSLYMFGRQMDEIWTGYETNQLPEPFQPSALREYEQRHRERIRRLRAPKPSESARTMRAGFLASLDE